MNILPKKSWHVRTNKNIERVKRDEAQAAEENKKRQERAALAEQEARTELLRKRARQLTSADDPDNHQLPSGSDHDDRLAIQTSADLKAGHVDFFSHLSTEKQKGEKNEEHETEEKAAKEKYEQKIGLLTYLGQSSAEAQTAKPWYFRPPFRGTATSEEEQSCKDLKRKASLDPMMQMEKYLGVKKPKGDTSAPMTKTSRTDKPHTGFQAGVHLDLKSSSEYRMLRSTSPDDRKSTHRDHKSKHKHKHKRDKLKSGKRKKSEERREKHSEKKRKDGEPSLERRKETGGPSIQQLREERIRREAAERAKTLRLLSGEKIEGGAKRDLEEEMERPRRYNSQFHPELARNRHRQAHYGGI